MNYRGLNVNEGAGGEWLFDGMPATTQPHWTRYITLAEVQSLLPGSGASAAERAQNLQAFIDRMLDGIPVNLGSLNAEPLITIEITAKQVFRKIA